MAFSKSSKQVLAPLAEAASALIVLTSDAELNGTPCPDLTQISQAIASQITNLLDIASKIGGQPNADYDLKNSMKVGSTQGIHQIKLM